MVSAAGKYYLLARAAAAARTQSYTLGANLAAGRFFIFIPGPRAIRRPANGTDCVVYCLFGSLPSVRVLPHTTCAGFLCERQLRDFAHSARVGN